MRIAPLIAAIAGCAIAIAIICLSLGRRISMLVDRLLPGRPTPKPTDPMLIDADHFSLGPSSWPLPTTQFNLKLILTRQEQLVLCANAQSFTLGPVQKT